MRHSILLFSCLLTLVSASLLAQNEDVANPTPREAFNRAEALFSQGHVFTSEEASDLTALRTRLVESGDADLAADLDLLQLAAIAQASSSEARQAAEPRLAEDTEAWDLRDQAERNKPFWHTVRDAGLFTFTVATVSTLVLSFVLERNDALLKNGYFSDYQNRQQTQTTLRWTMTGTAATMFLSLFPLLWGESKR